MQRFEAFEHSRLRKVDAVRAARSMLMADPSAPSNKAAALLRSTSASAFSPGGGKVMNVAEAFIAAATRSRPKSKSRSPRRGSRSTAGDSNAMVELERRRIEQMQRKQDMDMQKFIDFEMQQGKIQEDAEKKAAMDAARQAVS